MSIITIQTLSGKTINFEERKFASGGMKDVHWGANKEYVVAFYRDKQNVNAKERVQNITDLYRTRIFEREGGEYWKNLLCWPSDVVEHNGLLGIVCPTYSGHFFFKYGSVNNDMLGIKGNEKEGKWFASASNQNRFLDPKEKGDWRSYLRICILISRAVKKLHSTGLAHSDLSYKNVLIDPSGGHACIIDIDSLVVPGKYPPDVVGTPDFIAPEVMSTKSLKVGDPNKALPNINTDKHALAVLIYMYLLYRHPLRGDKVHDMDPQIDEELSMGSKALFVEHPKDRSNSINEKNVKKTALPWGDPTLMPYTICGPYLSELFERAFIKDLHNPIMRPSANEWEMALIKTLDLTQPCLNEKCNQKWFVFDNNKNPKCPFCNTPYTTMLPVINLYSAREEGKYKPDNHRIMVYHNQYLYKWHVDRTIFPNERISNEDKKPLGYFVYHNHEWKLVNQNMPHLKDINNDILIPIGGHIVLDEGVKMTFINSLSGRLAVIQMVNGK